MAPQAEDWGAVLEALLEGDRPALAKLTRLVNSFLVRWNAYDFRDEWDDLIQEVLLAAATAWREGRLRERRAVAAYLRSTTRFKFADRLKARIRRAEKETLPWEEVVEGALEPPEEGTPGLARDLQEALERLPERPRLAVVAVHVEGRTYEEAARETGIPLGSLKRHLRDGLARLRDALSERGSPA